jgi:hypothetical protein
MTCPNAIGGANQPVSPAAQPVGKPGPNGILAALAMPRDSARFSIRRVLTPSR